MADVIDDAQELNEFFLARALRNQSAKPAIPFSGSCLSCSEPIEKGRYCDKDCREAHELKMKRNR